MVQSMSSNKNSAVKLELDHILEDQLGPLHKKCKHKQSSEIETAALFNPLEEPSPLGLRLKKTPSFLDLIQMRLGQENKKNPKPNAVSASDKLKASNFPGSLLRIGTWEYKSRYEGDLVAKCYFAKHKLVWEVLDGGLKNKIEIQWSDIVAIKANCADDVPGTLDVVLARQPLFFRETNPQPRKHTLWQATSDFTGGQASIHRQHFLQCPQGLLGKHFEKLIQCDPRLNFLSQQPEISVESPYFESRVPVFDDSDASSHLKREETPIFFTLQGGTSPAGAQSTSSTNEQEDYVDPSHSSVVNPFGIGGIQNARAKEPKLLSHLDRIKVPGLHPSMSVSDLVNHIGNHISEQITSGNSTISSDALQGRDILEEITQYLFSDTQLTSASDEQILMSRVNSLCCLLQKDYAAAQNLQATCNNEGVGMHSDGSKGDANRGTVIACESEIGKSSGGSDDVSGCKQPPAMSRKDSVAELLHNLPRIASLPQFIFNFSEDSNYVGR